jgi:hypothetical protein
LPAPIARTGHVFLALAAFLKHHMANVALELLLKVSASQTVMMRSVRRQGTANTAPRLLVSASHRLCCIFRQPLALTSRAPTAASAHALSYASCRSSSRRAWLRAAATAARRVSPHGDVRGGLGHTTFETVCGSLSRRDEAEGRPAPKAAPRLARARPPSTGKPGLRRFCAGDAYRARCQTVRRGAPVRARASPPPVVGCREAQSPVTVGTPPSSLTIFLKLMSRLRLFSFV